MALLHRGIRARQLWTSSSPQDGWTPNRWKWSTG